MEHLGPLVQFARFREGKLEVFKAHTKELEYVAISHVWGEVSWTYVPIIGRDVKISEQKAAFVSDELQQLIGETPFWMDTLTVNQQDQGEVIAMVQSIPAIFRDASKTIAIRECDGIYACCGRAAEGIDDEDGIWKAVALHVVSHHDGCLVEESYTKRLWTLQECLLSHTITFVSALKGRMVKRDSVSREADPYHPETHIMKVLQDVQDLATSFCNHVRPSSTVRPVDFLRAYIFDGTVTRGAVPVRDMDESMYSNGFWERYRHSTRSATVPRDYIFATMPQFPWYRYPKEAEKMTFNELFTDFHDQANGQGHSFIYRILRGMSNPEVCDREDAWLPSKNLPEPKSLGDFLKLFGYPRSQLDKVVSSQRGITIKIETLTDDLWVDEEAVLGLLEGTMMACKELWTAAQRGGELCLFGSWPEDNPDDWPQLMLEGYSNTSATAEDSSYLQDMVRGYQIALKEAEILMESDEWLFSQARKILSNFWGSVDPWSNSANMAKNWRSFRGQMEGKWSPKLLQTLVLLTAMVNCQLPLSAAAWTKECFAVVQLNQGSNSILALLARHAVSGVSQDMSMVMRHFDRATSLLDAVIVDPSSSKPVGIVPNLSQQ